MAAPTIPNGEEHFFPITYEGNGGGQRVGKFVPFTDQATIANSCIFDSASNAYLSRTPASAGNRKTFTISFWVKRGRLGDQAGSSTYGQRIFHAADSSSAFFDIKFSGTGDTEGENRLHIREYSSSAEQIEYWTNRTFEDTSKWYHILLAMDTTQSTSGDRIKLYVDGDQITSWYRSNAPSLNFDTLVNATVSQQIGRFVGSTAGNLDAYLAEFNLVDGQALIPASFGITDTSTGRWIPKTVEPFPTTTTDIAVTVVSSGGNKYALDGVTQDTVTLIEGATYKFDQSDSSNSGHPLRFSTTSDGTHGSGSEYTTGVTTVGTPGSSGAYTQITVATGAPTLYYYCSSHSGMGGTANTQDQYGTNGFRLTFADSSSFGDDTSGNTNDFTSTNLATTDQTTDSPTQNHATLNANPTASGGTLSEGNLKLVTNNVGYNVKYATLKPKTGKYYAEFTIGSGGTAMIGVQDANILNTATSSYFPYGYGYGWYEGNGNVYDENVAVVLSGTSYTSGDVIAMALDLDNQILKWYKNNSLTYTVGLNGTDIVMAVGDYANSVNATITCNFGQKSFNYTPPTGFVALQQDNLPETDKGIVGLTWIKDRDNAYSHGLRDSSRGRHKDIFSNLNQAEVTNTDGVQKFLKGGIQIEDLTGLNASGASIVAWNWVANGGTTASNTNGSITSVVQANQTAGFSIVQYTGTGSAATVGHGLSSAPEWFVVKELSNANGWIVSHKGLTSQATYSLNLSNANAEYSDAGTYYWNNAAPTSSVFSIATDTAVNRSSGTYIAYCWHGVDGFSKFGKYTGNGNVDGPFIYTGFKPRFLIIRGTNASNWRLIDTARNPFNPTSIELYADTNGADYDMGARGTDFLSNGFKIRQEAGYGLNNSSQNYIYMAFAEHPFVGDGTSPVTAR
tara:strand:+ start:165 stop:2879 length:2715 start_codon:yes stop_codon:yes gene_type:complete